MTKKREYKTIQIEKKVHKKIKKLVAEEDIQIRCLIERLVDNYLQTKNQQN